MDNYKLSVLSKCDAFGLSQSIANITDGEDYQRGSIEKMGTGGEIVRHFNTRTLQYLGHLIGHN